MSRRRPESDPDKCLGLIAGHELYGECPRCKHGRRMAIAPLARKYGRLTHYTFIEQLLVCSQCGHKNIPLRKVRWDEDTASPPIPY
jgi:hypothetical protein